MSRNNVILYPQVSPETWAKTHRISILSKACVKCGAMQTASVPFATKELRGLEAPLHGCGEQYQLTVVVNVDPAERAAWASLHRQLCGELREPSNDPT